MPRMASRTSHPSCAKRWPARSATTSFWNMRTAISFTCRLSRSTASAVTLGQTGRTPGSRASTPPTGAEQPKRRVSRRRSSLSTSWTCTRVAARLRAWPARQTRPSSSRWRRASRTSPRTTSSMPSPTSRRIWRRPSPWTACSAVTWASERPRSLCARRSNAWTAAGRSWCSAQRRFWPSSTTKPSSSASPRLAWRSRSSAVSARPGSRSARSRPLLKAGSTCSWARTACYRAM